MSKEISMNVLDNILDMAENSIKEYFRDHSICPNCHTFKDTHEEKTCDCLREIKNLRKHELPYNDLTFVR